MMAKKDEPVYPPHRKDGEKLGKVNYGDLLSFAFEALDNKKKKGKQKDGR